MLDQLKYIERKLFDFKQKLELEKKRIWLRRLFTVHWLQRKINKFEEEQFFNVHNYLVEHDSVYESIARANLLLLVTKDLKFTVYRSEYSYAGSYTTHMNGNIAKNGYSYTYKASTNYLSKFSMFEQHAFPAEMAGEINCFGEFQISVTKVNYHLFKTLPKYLIGEVDDNGIIKVKTVAKEADFFTGGHMVMEKMICNHFKGRPNDREQFVTNRGKLKSMIRKFRQELVS